MKLNQVIPALIAAAGLLSLSAVQAQNTQNNPPTPPAGHPHMGNQGTGAHEHSDRLSQELNLTDEQKTKVQAVFEEMRQKVETAVQSAKTNADTELRGILTPEQYQKLQSMLEEHRPHRELHMGQNGEQQNGTSQ